MCQFASFFWNVKENTIAVWELFSHYNTEEHLELRRWQGWREGHYLPEGGEIECRQEPTDLDNIGRAAAVCLKEKCPDFGTFLETTLGKVTPLSEAVALSYLGRLDPESPAWELSDQYGDTVAHFAAREWELPPGFRRWGLRNRARYPVAHCAVYRQDRMPDTFDQWHLTCPGGWTAAHVAACMGKLPADFNQWDLADEKGETVRMAAQRHKQRLADRNASAVEVPNA